MMHRLPVQSAENNLPIDHGSRICGDDCKECQGKEENMTTEPLATPNDDQAPQTSGIGPDGKCFPKLFGPGQVKLT